MLPSEVFQIVSPAFKLREMAARFRSRRRLTAHGESPADLYDYACEPELRPGRRCKDDLSGWRVIDDWPERVPVTLGEVDVFEAWFAL